MAGEDIQSWSVTAADNGNSDTSINWAEGQPRASVNNSARSMMAAHAKQRNLFNGSIVTGGTANAQTFTSGVGYTAPIPTGLRVLLKIGPSLTNTTAATLEMDGLGAVAIQTSIGGALVGGELVADTYSEFVYNGTNWRIVVDLSSKVSKAGDTMTGPLVVNSTIHATGDIGSDAAVSGATVSATGTMTAATLAVTGTMTAAALNASGVISGGGLNAGASGITCSGNITCTAVVSGVGLNAGGSGITTTGNIQANGTVTAAAFVVGSDARIKNVLGEYTDGLEVITQLNPVRYSFKGNGGDSKQFVGLVAQDVEAIMPYMVKKQVGQIDGQPVTDLRVLDINALIYALVNSVQDLLARIEELEAR